jgi:hypothetical protein
LTFDGIAPISRAYVNKTTVEILGTTNNNIVTKPESDDGSEGGGEWKEQGRKRKDISRKTSSSSAGLAEKFGEKMELSEVQLPEAGGNTVVSAASARSQITLAAPLSQDERVADHAVKWKVAQKNAQLDADLTDIANQQKALKIRAQKLMDE